MKYCIYCGKKLEDDARFCNYCGKEQPEQEETDKTVKTEPAEKPVKKKASSRPAKTAASRTTRTVKTDTPDKPVRTKASSRTAKTETSEKPVRTARAKKQIQKTAAEIKGAIQASSEAGEFAAGDSFEFGGETLKGYQEALSPISAAVQTVGSFFGGMLGILKNPPPPPPLLFMANIWIILWFLRGSDNPAVKILSFLTFANTGEGRSIAGTVGTVFGKGTVAAFWASLFSGGIPALFKGFGGMIRGTGEKRGILQLLAGMIIGAALYCAFSGIGTASLTTAMTGIAGACLALESIGRKSGPLYDLAAGLTAGRENGVRTARNGKAQSLLSGLFLGFAAAAAVLAYL